MTRQVTWWRISVRESRAAVKIHRCKRMPRQLSGTACVDRVALVMVESVIAHGRGEVRKTTGDRADAIRGLVGIGDVCLQAAPEAGRAHGKFCGLYQGAGDCDRQKNVRIADRIMIEEVPDLVAEVVNVDGPSAHRNCDAELEFLVALPMQRQEAG